MKRLLCLLALGALASAAPRPETAAFTTMVEEFTRAAAEFLNASVFLNIDLSTTFQSQPWYLVYITEAKPGCCVDVEVVWESREEDRVRQL